MTYNTLKLAALILLSLGLTELQAQEAVPASGGNATGSGGSSSYTLGQVAYTTHGAGNITVSEGVQQAFEISTLSVSAPYQNLNLSLLAYPNPATDFLVLKVGKTPASSIQSLAYQLYDLGGKLIVSQKLQGSETRIDTRSLQQATYFLKVTEDQQELQTFKIIKN